MPDGLLCFLFLLKRANRKWVELLDEDEQMLGGPRHPEVEDAGELWDTSISLWWTLDSPHSPQSGTEEAGERGLQL